MKHMVRMPINVEAGNAIEARPGGPAPIIGRVLERFKPEAVYMCPTRRELIMVADLSSGDMAELMMVGSHIAGQYPEILPVITGAEFGAVVGKAMPSAKKIVDG